jgi:hypothetical protein
MTMKKTTVKRMAVLSLMRELVCLEVGVRARGLMETTM